jgi:hypothetical protein
LIYVAVKVLEEITTIMVTLSDWYSFEIIKLCCFDVY